nr:reverse transcriptase domain-containing protein [Tanacetum cinerariifolium]
LGGQTGVRVGRGGRGRRPREGCSYKEFLACNPKEYNGKGGAIVLTRWIENMENVKDISGCSIDQKEVVVSISWNDLKFMTIEEFCPSHEMQKLENKLWNHAMVEAGHVAYTDRFHELATLVPHLVTLESRKIDRNGGNNEAKDNPKGRAVAGTLTDEAFRNGSIKKNPNKRGNGGEPSRDRNVRDDNKRNRTGNAFVMTANPVRKEYTSTKPKCTTCNYHHLPEIPCHACFKCNR